MDYSKEIDSLEEKAQIKVAINLCQTHAFKETVLCLEKPTLGELISASYVSDEMKLAQWDAAMDEQCQRLTESVPHSLKHGVKGWLNRMALAYLSYCRRQEVLFGLSRYFLMSFLTREDWTEAGRLDEKKLAERLVEDERITVFQRYRIACAYSLHADSEDCMIPQLWKQLTQEEKQSISGNDDPNLSQEKNHLVLLWSYYNDGRRHDKVTRQKNYLWQYAVQCAVYDGNRAALIPCWQWLTDRARQSMLMDMALSSLRQWVRNKNRPWKENLVSKSKEFTYVEFFNLPFYYSDLLCFFLSEMTEEQQLAFFRKAFQDKFGSSVLECFLDWPYQDYFLPTVRTLWRVLPKDKYSQCLLTLASKYSSDYDWKIPPALLYKKEDEHYDYRRVLFTLWEETPDDYKRYVFTDKASQRNNDENVINESRILLPRLLKRYPFEEMDERFFKCVLNEITLDERKVLIHSKSGESMCSTLTQRENWSLVNWLLEVCLPANEIAGFKKQFVQSDWGRELCFYKLKRNSEKLLADLIDWAFESEDEKSQFKHALIFGRHCLEACQSLICEENFSDVERMINFCLSSDEMKAEFKTQLSKYTCSFLLERCKWDQIDKILNRYFDSEEKRIDIKKDIFSHKATDLHYDFVFQERWQDVKHFYQWFKLSSEAIKELKKETIFLPIVIQDINESLYEDTDILPTLHWCLYDEEIVFNFKEKLEEKYFKKNLDEEETKAKERLEALIGKLMSSLKKGVQTKKRGSTSLEEEQPVSSKKLKLEEQTDSAIQAEKRTNDTITEALNLPTKWMAK